MRLKPRTILISSQDSANVNTHQLPSLPNLPILHLEFPLKIANRPPISHQPLPDLEHTDSLQRRLLRTQAFGANGCFPTFPHLNHRYCPPTSPEIHSAQLGAVSQQERLS